LAHIGVLRALENAGLAQILPQSGFLLMMGLAFFAIAVWRFRFVKPILLHAVGK
jgi:hypothetical protein